MLPPELISHVFSFLLDTKLPTRGVGKRLHPFFQGLLYRQVQIKGARQFRLLRRGLAINPDNGAFVEGLKLSLVAITKAEDGALLFYEMLSSMSWLEELTLVECTRFTTQLISGPSSLFPSFLPRLRTLNIVDSSAKFRPTRALDPLLYRHLHLYLALNKLSLDIAGAPTIPGESIYIPSSPRVTFPFIKNLKLSGAIVNNSSAANFLPSFNRIESLVLDFSEDPTPSKLPPVLESILPSRLTNLKLGDYSEGVEDTVGEWEPFSSIDRTFGRFTQLRHLVLTQQVATGIDLFDSLPWPLESLVLGIFTQFNLKALLGILRGPKKLRYLKEIDLELYVAEEAPLSVQFEEALFERSDGTWGIAEEWEAPLWPSDITRGELNEFLKTAKEEGVVVKGNTLELCEEFNLEVATCVSLQEFITQTTQRSESDSDHDTA